ncbi:1,4-dihydroxy-2-naphthoate octaprenyltransferase [Corynebacterium pelargi]|uniref:1,4-dihydroxy-2-naphthoate octaprenyltransferase n=2 Tax=Corynebacterium pelargi TaxID=1471400 RepID=A0A410WBA0_9CORY|nr:1,4-dihydroxy-2-naphthoate octaprenyltransferase [Corynebacterium pelargi]
MRGTISAMSSSKPHTATAADWLEGARPHTWANAFAPVLAGSGAAAYAGHFHLGRALLAAIVAWALIVGVNYANDYSDGIRGTDDDRSGPLRLTGSGLAKPEHVKFAAFGAFGLAGIAGIWLSLLSAPWLILLGLLCVAGAWFYTGGKNPYGYRGFGEIAVFVFFGLVAVLGTEYTQAGAISWVGLGLAVAIGAMSSAVNLTNNLRDIPTDRKAGKITLAVKLGDAATRKLYLGLMATPFVVSLLLAATAPWAAAGVLALPFALAAAQPIRSQQQGKALIPVLGLSGRAMLVWSIATSVALALI